MTSRETITLDARAQQRLTVLTHVLAGELTADTRRMRHERHAAQAVDGGVARRVHAGHRPVDPRLASTVVVIVPVIPRSAAGKPRRAGLRQTLSRTVAQRV